MHLLGVDLIAKLFFDCEDASERTVQDTSGLSDILEVHRKHLLLKK